MGFFAVFLILRYTSIQPSGLPDDEVGMKSFSGDTILINVDRIPDEGLAIRVREPFERFPGLKDLAREENIRFLFPIQMELRIRRISRFVEADGSLKTSVRLACSRCLGDYSQSLTIPFEATYTREVPVPDALEGTDVELTPEAIDLYRFHGREIDLTEAIQEHIILSLPLRPLCRADCKGLCPQCGADLNKGACKCDGGVVDPRFAALKNLHIEQK